MNVEILKPLLGEAEYTALNDALKDKKGKLADLDSGAYVSSEKYQATAKQLADTQGLLASNTAEYDELKKAAGDNTALTQQIDQMKADYDKQRQELVDGYEAQLKRGRIEREIISKHNPNDVNDIMPHIDLSKVTVSDDGITGLEEQMKALKEQKAYYFQTADPQASGLDHKQQPANDDPFAKGFENAFK